jgi:hypothetical protein
MANMYMRLDRSRRCQLTPSIHCSSAPVNRHVRYARAKIPVGREGQEITPEMTADLLAEPQTGLAVAMFGEEDASLRRFAVRKFNVPKSCSNMHRYGTPFFFSASMWRY